MTAKKKTYKKLTNAEKKINKRIRQEMIEAGYITVKPRLNRKKFCKEAEDDFKENFKTDGDIEYLLEAIIWMLPRFGNVSLEEVGICKTLKIAMAIKRFKDDLRAKGEKKYSPAEMYEKIIKPIKEA